MSENLHDIDKLFRDAIEEHGEMPDAGIWENLDKNLDKNNITTIQRKYSRLKRFAYALLLILLGTILYEIQSKKSSKESVDRDKMNTDNAIHKTTIPNDNSVPNTSSYKPGANKTENTGDDKSVNNDDPGNKGLNTVNTGNADKPDQVIVYEKTDNTKENKNISQDKPVNPHFNMVNPTRASKNGQIQVNKKADNDLTGTNNSIQTNTVPAIKGRSVIKEKDPQKVNISISDPTPVDANAIAAGNVYNSTPGNSGLWNSLLRIPKANLEKVSASKSNHQPGLVLLQDKIIGLETAANNNTSVERARTNRKGKPFHFSASLFFAPLFSSNRIEDDHKDGRHDDRNAIKENEQRQTAYSFGLSVEVPFAKRWGLQSGITFLNKKTDIAPQKIYAKMDNDGTIKYQFNCSSGYSYIAPKAGTTPAVGDSINVSASTNELKYIGIPLAIKYNFNIGKFNISPTVGTSINILVKQNIETGVANGNTYDKQTINNIQGLKPSYLNGFGGISLDYNLNKKVAVNLTPAGNFALSSINKNSSVKSYPNALGVSAGIKIKF